MQYLTFLSLAIGASFVAAQDSAAATITGPAGSQPTDFDDPSTDTDIPVPTQCDGASDTDLCILTAQGFNVPAATFLEAAATQDAFLNGLDDIQTNTDFENFVNTAVITDGPGEFSALAQFATAVNSDDRGAFTSVIDAALALQTGSVAASGASSNSGMSTTVKSSSVSGSVSAKSTSEAGNTSHASGATSTHASSTSTGMAAKNTGAAVVAAAGILGGIAGLAIGL